MRDAADVRGKDNGTIKIQDGLAETLVFRANANMPVGGAKLRVVAKAKGKAGAFEVADEVDVPFLPSGPKGARSTEAQGHARQARSHARKLRSRTGWRRASKRLSGSRRIHTASRSSICAT
jgi:hypothetical protein